MRVFLAGGTGALGMSLLPLLVEAGHPVVATTRSPDKLAALARAGAEPVVMDGLDRESVQRAVTEARPDAVIHQLTSLSPALNLRRFDQSLAATNRLRTEGTDHLLAAAVESGAKRIIVQSYAGWNIERSGGPVKDETVPLDANPVAASRAALSAIRHIEEVVPAASGISGLVLRYGSFYGPATGLSRGGEMVDLVRRRRLPVVGGGGGVWSFVHIADAARATLDALEAGSAGVYNVADDEPAAVSEWLPFLAEAIGAKPPRHVPAWLVKPMIGDVGISMMTRARGVSNAKAKRELGWTLAYPSWRVGFRSGLGRV